MSRKSVQRFCDNDMRKNRGLKRERESHKIATRFNICPPTISFNAMIYIEISPKTPPNTPYLAQVG
jgi:hypothetical protein